jgi:hypothetical protein
MSSNLNPKQTPITKFTCQHHKSYLDTTPSTTSTSVPDTPASAHTTDSNVFVSTPASAKNKCTPPGEGEALIRDQQIRVMTLICRLKDLKETMRKNKKNNKDKKNNKQENTTSVPDDSSRSLNQSLDCSLMNSQTFDVQDLLLSDDTDSIKAVFESSFDDNQDKQEERNKGSNEEATVLFDVSCIDTSSARKHNSDGNEAANGSAP